MQLEEFQLQQHNNKKVHEQLKMHRFIFLSPLYNLQVVVDALLIIGETLSKGKEQQSHKRTQVSQIAATLRSKESSDQGISECSALQHGAFSSVLPTQVKKLT